MSAHDHAATAVRIVWPAEDDRSASGPIWATVRYACRAASQPEVLIALSATAPAGHHGGRHHPRTQPERAARKGGHAIKT